MGGVADEDQAPQLQERHAKLRLHGHRAQLSGRLTAQLLPRLQLCNQHLLRHRDAGGLAIQLRSLWERKEESVQHNNHQQLIE